MEQSTNESVDKLQIDKFKEAARELECDDNEVAFDKRIGKLVKSKIQAPDPSD